MDDHYRSAYRCDRRQRYQGQSFESILPDPYRFAIHRSSSLSCDILTSTELDLSCE